MAQPDPSLSVVVVTRDVYQTLRPIVTALGRQTIADRIELVVVAPAHSKAKVPAADAAPFNSVQVVEVGPVTNRGAAAASGVKAARAPIVALSENHCFPEPGWAAGTLASHEGPWAGVGPAVVNANPASPLSRQMYAFGYGRFPRSGTPGVVEELPLHNSSYRKAALPESLEELRHLLANERRLQRWLRDRGGQLYFAPRAVKWHLNEATWVLLMGMWFFGGRGYAATRAMNWPAWKRAVYALAGPLLAAPIVVNIWTRLGVADERGRSVALIPPVLVGALCHAAGETLSYLGLRRTEFQFVEDEEFLIRERLGGHPLEHPEIASLVALLDQPARGES